MSQRFKNPWDASQTIAGSVYGTATYASGAEVGLPVYTAPATKYFTPEIGASARHNNWALQQLGEAARTGLIHQAMVFKAATDWPSTNLFAVEHARHNRAFLVSALNGVYLTDDGTKAAAVQLYSTTASRATMWDAGDHIWDIDDGVNDTHRVDSTSVTNTNDAGSVGLVGGTIGTKSIYLYTSGTAVSAQAISGTTWTTTTVPAGTYASSTISVWGRSQAFLGASTATGPLLFFSRDASTHNYLYTTDGTTLNKGTWPVSSSTTQICDVAYDDVQNCFVLCTRPNSTPSPLTFYTSSDGITWTVSNTATGPGGTALTGPYADGSTAFKIVCGVWIVATTVQYDGAIFGASGGSGVTVFTYYSADFGQTWYPANMIPMFSTTGAVKIAHTLTRAAIYTDKGICLSGRLGFPEAP